MILDKIVYLSLKIDNQVPLTLPCKANLVQEALYVYFRSIIPSRQAKLGLDAEKFELLYPVFLDRGRMNRIFLAFELLK